MARNRQPVLKKCRALGIDPVILGVNKSSKRGPRPNANRKPTEYAVQLREKQKARRIYGILEGQFRTYYEKADHIKGITGENLLKLLEMRLDNVVYRLGYGASRNEARQLVTHGHFLVNGKKVDICSYNVSVNDVITVCEKSRSSEKFKTFAENPKTLPKWLEANVENYEGKVVAEPAREDIDVPVNETLIVELYSK